MPMHFPELYFEVRVETGGLSGIKMVWKWKSKVQYAKKILIFL